MMGYKRFQRFEFRNIVLCASAGIFKIDGLVKSPTPALCYISQSFNVRSVRLIITKFARLEFELFTRPSKSDFLRIHQN